MEVASAQAAAPAQGAERSRPPYRVAFLTSHPIQYQAPLFRALAAHPELDLTVLFCSDWGVTPYRDEGFGHQVQWDVPLLDGYAHEFLPNRARKPGVEGFWSQVNPSVVGRVRQGGWDALIVHGWARATNLMAIRAALAARVPVILRGENNLLPAVSPWKARARRAALPRFFRRASAFLAIGRHNAGFYRAYGVPEDRIFLAPYAVDNDFFLARAEALAAEKAELKRALGIDPALPVVLFSGKLTAVKRPADLLRAFEVAASRHPAALVFLGDGALRADLEAYVKALAVPNVVFAGFRNQSELPRVFGAADVFVLPSGFERWGLVVNEAMCFGLPVIASDQVGAAGDLVAEGENGFVYPAGDVDRLGRALERLLGDAELRARMGAASRERIRGWGIPQDVEGVRAALARVARVR
jgi:glycosyltransferase involved in cell wall biosynthesis